MKKKIVKLRNSKKDVSDQASLLELRGKTISSLNDKIEKYKARLHDLVEDQKMAGMKKNRGLRMRIFKRGLTFISWGLWPTILNIPSKNLTQRLLRNWHNSS